MFLGVALHLHKYTVNQPFYYYRIILKLQCRDQGSVALNTNKYFLKNSERSSPFLILANCEKLGAKHIFSRDSSAAVLFSRSSHHSLRIVRRIYNSQRESKRSIGHVVFALPLCTLSHMQLHLHSADAHSQQK